MKRIINVRVPGDYEGPELAEIELSELALKEIKQHSALVKNLGVYCIEKFDYTPTFYMHDDDSEDELALLPIDTEDHRLRIDCITLKIRDDSFQWTGYLKHTGIKFSTDSIAIEHEEAKTNVLTDITRAVFCINEDFNLLLDESWEPDSDSIQASIDNSESISSKLEQLGLIK